MTQWVPTGRQWFDKRWLVTRNAWRATDPEPEPWFIVRAPQWFDARKIVWQTLSQAGIAVPKDLQVTPLSDYPALVADMQRRHDARPKSAPVLSKSNHARERDVW